MAVSAVRSLIDGKEPKVVGLQGGQGSGKTHLLEAACYEASNQRAVYIPLKQCIAWSPMAVLEDLHNQSFVCIDDVDAVFQNPEWQQELFHFYNRLIDGGGALLFSYTQPLASVHGVLPDLLSRLKMALNIRLYPLRDEDCEQVFLNRAEALGISLSNDLKRYIFTHLARDLNQLMSVLDSLDTLSLVEKKKPSIPLLKKLLEEKQQY